MSEGCEVEGEDKVVFRTVGAVVVFADVEEVKAHMALFE
jgi:chaperonin cofactor prefoldin